MTPGTVTCTQFDPAILAENPAPDAAALVRIYGQRQTSWPVSVCAQITKRVIVPQPPQLNLTPTKKLALVTVVVGESARAMFAITRPFMEQYAARLNADLVILQWPGHPQWPMSSKFAIGKVLDYYDRIAYVDADVLLRPGCVDLFAACEPHEFGAVDELWDHRRAPEHKIEAEYVNWRRSHGFPEAIPTYYGNLGVMVVPKSHQAILLPPVGPIETLHCGEQHHTNAQLLASGLPWRDLDRRCNWQWWLDSGFENAPTDAILHIGASTPNRMEELRRWSQPGYHPWNIDSRHCSWIRETLRSGRFRKVLEIGSFRGYSTQAFLDALDCGAIDELHLCEPNPTPELWRLIRGKRVTLHRYPSVEVLAEIRDYDLVFVDGDHSEVNVRAEAELLIDMGCAVFAHDTAMAGPAALKAAMQHHGYRVLEDNVQRAGERTERGLVFGCWSEDNYDAALEAYSLECYWHGMATATT